MSRYLHVLDGVVINVVGWDTPPLKGDLGEDIVLDPTGTTNVGDAYDITNDLKERRLNAIDPVVLKELLRLMNDVQAAQNTLSGAPTPPVVDGADPMADYRAYLKTQM